MRQRIRLTESSLHRIIKESVRRILREYKNNKEEFTFNLSVPFCYEYVEVRASISHYNEPEVNYSGFEIEDYDVIDENLSPEEKDQVYDWIEENMGNFEEQAYEAYVDELDYIHGEDDDYYDRLWRKQHYGY